MSGWRRLWDGFRKLVLGEDPRPGHEGRVTPRILCQYRVVVRREQDEFAASLVDLGPTGMRLEGGPPMAAGERWRVAYPLSGIDEPPGGLEVEVMWCRLEGDKRVAGLRCLEPPSSLKGSWLYALFRELGLVGEALAQKRQHVRLTTTHRAFLRDLERGGHLLEGRVVNLSLGGALIESERSLRLQRKVLALIGPNANYPLLAVEARVVSCRREPSEGRSLVSLEFLAMSKEETRALERLLVSLAEGRTAI